MRKFFVSAMVFCMLFASGCAAVPTYEAVSYSSYDELSSAENDWGLVRKQNSPPEVDAGQSAMLSAFDGYYIDGDGGKVLYLTFDEGYENGYTAKILDVLEAENVKAAFFVTGPYLENQTELVQRMVREGHIVGNHTVNHINMANEPADKVKEELNAMNERCEELYGVKMSYVRPPEGAFSEKSLAVSRDLGYKTILWSFAYADWDINKQQGAEFAKNSVIPYLHDGAIILLHAVSSDNAQALGDIIRYAKNEGYEFKSLDELN